jgi:hypothetical protein
VPTLSLTLQPRPKLIYSQCAYGPGQCQLSICMGHPKGPSLCLFFKMASPNTGRFPAYVSMDPGQAQSTGRQATYVPKAMCSTAAPVPADSQPMYLKGPWQCQPCH